MQQRPVRYVMGRMQRRERLSDRDGFMTPAATPAAVVDRMSKEVNAILREPAISKRLIELGAQPQGGAPAEFASFIAHETRKWGEVIKTADVKPE